MSREDSSITYSSLLLMAKIEVTSLAFFLSCSFSLRFINQSRANREGTIAKLCVVEAETWVQSYFTHCLSVTWLSTTQIFSPRKETKSIGLWRRFLSEARLSVDTLYHIYYYLSHFVQQQNAGKSALLEKWRYQCRVSSSQLHFHSARNSKKGKATQKRPIKKALLYCYTKTSSQLLLWTKRE